MFEEEEESKDIEEESKDYVKKAKEEIQKSKISGLKSIPENPFILIILALMAVVIYQFRHSENMFLYIIGLAGFAFWFLMRQPRNDNIMEDIDHWKKLADNIFRSQRLGMLPSGFVKPGSSKIRTVETSNGELIADKKLFGFSIFKDFKNDEYFYLAEMSPYFPGKVSGKIRMPYEFDPLNKDSEYLDLKIEAPHDIKFAKKVMKFNDSPGNSWPKT